jgi:hypothetical protein
VRHDTSHYCYLERDGRESDHAASRLPDRLRSDEGQDHGYALTLDEEEDDVKEKKTMVMVKGRRIAGVNIRMEKETSKHSRGLHPREFSVSRDHPFFFPRSMCGFIPKRKIRSYSGSLKMWGVKKKPFFTRRGKF